MAGYSSTAVYKEWKLSKSQRLYVIFAKNDQDSGLVSNCVLVSLFVEGRCSCGYSILLKLLRFKFEVKLQRRMVHDEFLQVLEQDRYGYGETKKSQELRIKFGSTTSEIHSRDYNRLEHSQFGGSEIRFGSSEEAATLGGYGGAVLSFQSYISGLLQCEKISEVLRISFQEQQRFSLVLCEEDVGSVSMGSPQEAWSIHMDQEEQFKVELFESITKLNKFREFSKSSYKEINSKCCWYCHKRVQEGLSYGENRVLGKVWNMQGICIPGCGGVMQVRELQVSTTESVSGIVTGFGLSRDLYIESLLNRVELGGVFCWSKQWFLESKCFWCEAVVIQFLQEFQESIISGYGKSQRKINEEVWRDTSLWSGGKRNLRRRVLGVVKAVTGFTKFKGAVAKMSSGYEAEEYIFSGDCKEMQDTEDEQVCSITGGKLKRR
ncbi:hypothetical protein YC2023_116283 [Brassica napus]